MEIATTSVFSGPSVFSQEPVVHYGLGGLQGFEPEAARMSSRELLDALSVQLPGLRANSAPCGAPGCFEKSGDAASIEHLFEHVCVELQNLAGAELSCVRVHGPGRKGPSGAAVPYEDPRACVAAGELARDAFSSLVAAPSAHGEGDAASFDFAKRVEEFVVFAARNMLPVQDRALIRTARALDIPAVRLVGRMIQLGYGRFQQRLSATKTSLTNVVSNDLAANKDYSRRVLGDLGLPIPRYERVYRGADAAGAAKRIGYPVVVKPNNGSMGGGVSVGMKNRREVNAAYKRARALGRSVLIEEVVEGADYRMLVIGGKLYAAAKRVPGHIVGDGTHTIEALVALVNSDPRRGTGPTSSWTRLAIDDQAERLISELGYTRESIPPKGEFVYLRRNANTSDGGTAVDVTDEVHPDNREIAVRAAKAIGLDIAGVDFLTKDISTSMWENGGSICEINSRPGIRKHLWPAEGKPRDVLTPIIDMLFPPGRRSRIPIIAVTGTGDTNTTARMLAHILTDAGHNVGLAAKNRVYGAGHPAGSRKLTGPEAARMILLDPDVDFAVLEIKPGEVRRHGLGCDRFDVAVIVDANEPVGSASGEAAAPDEVSADVIDAIRVVARTARDVVIVGETDPSISAIDEERDGVDLCRVAFDAGAQPAAGRAALGGRRAALEGASISVYDLNRREAQIPMAEMLGRLPGGDSAQLAQSALFASVAAYSLGQDPKDIYRSLSTFSAPAAARPRKARRKRKSKAAREANPENPENSKDRKKSKQDAEREANRESKPGPV